MTKALWVGRWSAWAWLACVGFSGCAHAAAKDEAHTLANGVGKYKVHLTTERERVMGTCKYIRMIQPDLDPVHRPTPAELPDYLRVEAVLMGADTVLVEGRVGEAYICGPGPLNPDGSLQGSTPSPK
jgi:hypothetical protein